MMWRRRESVEVPVGARFRRPECNNMMELAEVLAVARDRAGIPHVHYKVQFQRVNDNRPAIEKRTLALSAFTQLYPERMPA